TSTRGNGSRARPRSGARCTRCSARDTRWPPSATARSWCCASAGPRPPRWASRSAGSWSATPRCSASPPRCGGPPGSGSSSCPAPTTTRSSCWTTWPAEAAGNNPWTHAERLLTGEQALCRVRSRSALLEREAVGVTGVLGPGADPDRRRRALEVVVVHALPALTGAHVRDDLVQAALGAQRDERGARRVT